MMAAIWAAGPGNTVFLLEKNEKLGKKLFITGKGRCNVTNDCDVESLLAHIVTNPKFLYSAFYGFSSQDMKRFLTERGLKLKTERGRRVFPVSDHSSDVTACLTKELSRRGVKVQLGETVKELLTKTSVAEGALEQKNIPRIVGVRMADNTVYETDAVIVATGGLSYPSTGSTGDGHRFAEETGHQVTECSPALVPFESPDKWCQALQGLSLKNVNVTIYDGRKKLYEEFGEMLFTHFGVSGPAILSGSSVTAKRIKKGPLVLSIDLKPALTREQLDRRIRGDFEKGKNRQFQNSLGGLYPSKLIPVMVERSQIPPEKRVNEISREERERLVSLTKAFTLTLSGLRGYREAIITQGGVSVKEVDPSTMESKRVQGLYFAGEVLDLDGVTGGYNLQIAWSTGYAAGKGAGEKP
jgi:predicted Rossmann fold flavoprotein